ncbi:hypothetical protein DPSP01_003643 [Paraphaeosphaeria sporulosa]|uniref:Uncharacterized protein n=1 Tax=Paraphaeosphaeria sporulosa TaxID=1460663 RepID=A0A177BVR8_9PLEO|nr:uncharacterized protein CC84DRAFT_407449 [Paraphaeosphaeria sporulosa]OAF99502.1 hypothetical protein CC84DRAFT_407449 [Paraphaeosphaeria sporulosa]
MADVAAVSTQLQQWSFAKPAATRPERSDSTASSPDLSHHEPEALRIPASAVRAATSIAGQESATFQERYLSSEEDLSPMDGNSSDSDDYDSEVEIHEATATPATPSFFRARTMSISRRDNVKSGDMAVTVSYVSAGRPKMIQLAQSPVCEPPIRSASLAQLPIAAINKLRQQDNRTRSLIVNPIIRPSSPALSIDSRTPSTGSRPYAHSNKSAMLLSDSGSQSSLQSGDSTPRSSSPSVSEKSTTSNRPVSAAGSSFQPRSSLYVVSSARSNTSSNLRSPFPPLAQQPPAPHAFLSSDPYENSTTSAASPIIKQSPHKRLRSISQRLSLARIAIAPSKKYDSRANGNRTGNMPPTPSTPFTPLTPQTAPLPTSTGMNKLRRNSRMLSSRPGTARVPSPDIPPMPVRSVTSSSFSPQKSARSSKMIARGANEREPTLELPPCPVDDAGMGSLKTRRVRKRKSLMDLL